MEKVQFWGETLRLVVELAATAAFALAGIMEGARKQLDAVGVCVVGFLAAFGGGTLRDLLLDQRPFFWVQHVEMLWGVLGLCVLAMVFLRSHHFHLTEKAIQAPDALGLGLFAATGTHQALLLDLPGIVAVLMGVITGVFGGVLRDVLCNQIPKLYHDHRPYTLCAVVGCAVLLGMNALGFTPQVAMVAGICTATGSRLLAVAFGWKLPAWPAHKG